MDLQWCAGLNDNGFPVNLTSPAILGGLSLVTSPCHPCPQSVWSWGAAARQ